MSDLNSTIRSMYRKNSHTDEHTFYEKEDADGTTSFIELKDVGYTDATQQSSRVEPLELNSKDSGVVGPMQLDFDDLSDDEGSDGFFDARSRGGTLRDDFETSNREGSNALGEGQHNGCFHKARHSVSDCFTWMYHHFHFRVKSVLCEHRESKVQALAFRIIDHHWFKRSILLLITINSVLLAMWEPTKALYGIPSVRNNLVDNSELTFQIIYTCEAVLKVIALGLISKKDSYLRNGWDIMDFIIVSLGWVAIVLDENSSLSGFRIVRMLRPLRTIRSLPGLRVLVLALLRALEQLAIVGMLLLFTLLVFGIVGVSLFSGNLRQHCVDIESGQWEPDEDRLCGLNGDGRQCPTGYSCVREFNGTEFSNPAQGLIGFDNIAQASLTLFTCITREGWSDVMYQVRDTTNGWTQLYFVLLIVFGSFFILNLIIAVVTVNYSIERRAEGEKNGEAAQLDAVIRNARMRKEQERKFSRKGGKKHALAVTQMRLMISYELHHDDEGYKSVTKEEYESYKALHSGYFTLYKQKYALRHGLTLTSPVKRKTKKANNGKEKLRSGDEHMERLVIPGIKQTGNRNTMMITNDDEVHDDSNGIGSGDNMTATKRNLFVETGESNLINDEIEGHSQHTMVENNELINQDTQDSNRNGVTEDETNGVNFQLEHEPAAEDTTDDQLQLNNNVEEVEYGLATGPMSPRSFVASHQTLGAAQAQLDRGDVSGAIELTKNALKELQVARKDQKLFGHGMHQGNNTNHAPFLGAIAGGGVGSLRSLGSLGRVSFQGSPSNANGASTYYPPIPAVVGNENTLPGGNTNNSNQNHGTVAVGLISDSLVVQWCYKITISPYFQASVVLMILLNTATLSAEHFGQPLWMFSFLDVSNTVFLIFFALEMFIKMIGLGWTVYFHSLFNTFDCIVVFSGFVEIVFKDSSAFSSLRVFRLLRVFKLARPWKSLNRLLKHMGATITKVAPFALVLFIILYIFTVSGLHLFGGLFTIPQFLPNGANNPEFDCTPLAGEFILNENVTHCPNRVNYDTFLWALVTTFQALTGENWNEIMYLAVEHTSMWAIVYYLAIVVFGSFIVLNLFLAILIDTFVEKQQSEDGGDTGSSFDESKAEEHMETVLHQQRRQKQQSNWGLEDHPALKVPSLGIIAPTNVYRLNGFVLVRSKLFNGIILLVILVSSVSLIFDSPQLQFDAAMGDAAALTWVKILSHVDLVVTLIFLVEAVLKILVYGFVQHEGSYLRDGWNVLDFLIVIISVMGLAADSNLGAFKALRALRALRPLRLIQRLAGLRVVLFALGRAVIPCIQVLAMCMLFFVVLAIVSVSLFGGKLHGCYSASTSDQIELAATLNVSLGFNGTNQAFTNATTSKADPDKLLWQRNNHAVWLQPLTEEDVAESSHMDLTGKCFPYPNYRVTNCVPLSQCVGRVPPLLDSDTGATLTLPQRPIYREWRNPSYTNNRGVSSSYSFDNVLSAMLTLFEVSTMELWFLPMYEATDISITGHQPIRGSNDYASLFFLFFVLFSNFFLLQLFVTVMIDVFQQTQQELTGAAFLTDEQRQWVDMHKRVIILKAGKKMKPTTTVRRKFFNIAENKRFRDAILLVITANTAILATEHHNQPDWLATLIVVSDFAFGLIYIMEFVIKLIAYGKRYFNSYRNLFDFVVVICVVVGMVNTLLPTETFNQSQAKGIVKAIEAMRVIRILRLSHYVPGLKDYLSTLFLSLPSLGNIGGILFLVYFVFAVAGMGLFGEIQYENPKKEFEFLTGYATFHNFEDSLVTLFRMSTGESWNGLMREMQISDPISATLFCVLFVLLVQFGMVNLFVAVILNNFELEITRETIDERSLGVYRRTWSQLVRRHAKQLRSTLEEEYLHGTRVAEEAAAAASQTSSSPSTSRRLLSPSRPSRRQRARLIRQMTKKLIDPMYLPASCFTKLFKRLEPPLGFSGSDNFTEAEMMRIIRIALVPVTRTGYIQYNSTLLALIDLKQKWNNPDVTQMSQSLKEMALALNMSDDQLNYLHDVQSNHAETHTLAEYLAAEKLQQHWRSWVEQRSVRDNIFSSAEARSQARRAVHAFKSFDRQPSDLSGRSFSQQSLMESDNGSRSSGIGEPCNREETSSKSQRRPGLGKRNKSAVSRQRSGLRSRNQSTMLRQSSGLRYSQNVDDLAKRETNENQFDTDDDGVEKTVEPNQITENRLTLE